MSGAKDGHSFVAIDDFFNANQLDEIGISGICDLIPGTMTGLGILGTFLGLVLGISGFDTASTEAITSSISGLLSGMGTAFLTSIVGVFFSLVFSYLHKIIYDYANKNLELFINNFHEKELDGHDNSTENQLLGYQQQQTDFQLQQTELLKTFAGIEYDAVEPNIIDED